MHKTTFAHNFSLIKTAKKVFIGNFIHYHIGNKTGNILKQREETQRAECLQTCTVVLACEKKSNC